MTKLLTAFIRNESGATAIEYGLISALIGVAIIVGAKTLGTALSKQYVEIAATINGVPTTGN